MMKVQHGMMTDGHLGGYVVGGDPATFFPGLWDWLVDVWEVRSVIDVGCGEGHAVRYFQDRLASTAGGSVVTGVEGIAQPTSPLIITHDYETGPYLPSSLFDLAWCCEFVEHVKEQYVPHFVETFKSARMVLMTHGEPGQPGYHHVNNQSADYWRDVMSGAGYEFDAGLTSQAREFSSMNTDPYNHFLRSGLAFRRRD